MNPYLAVVAKKRVAGGGGGPATPYYRSLTIDHTKVPSVQTDFPVLVSLSDTTLKTIANGGHVNRSDGFDIGFYSDSGLTTKLKWDMESYSGSAGTVVAWVKIASLSSTVDNVFYVGYGDDTITTDQSDKASTWSNNFISVYHLGNGTTLSVADALGVNGGTNVNGVSATAGQIDGCGSFVQASTQYIALGSGINPVALTYSAWVNAISFPNTYNAVISRNDGTVFTAFYVKSNGKLGPAFHSNPTGYIGYDGTGLFTLSTGTWAHVVVVFDSISGGFGYVNGAQDKFFGDPNEGLTTTVINTRIGADPNTAGREWNGKIDEVRIASIARSADWITTEYNNQNAPGTFITMGTETPA